MIRLLSLLVLLCAPTLAAAADRRIGLGSFERVRVDGPFEVRIVAGSPGATVSGDARAIERVAIRVDGATVVVRADSGGWGEQPRTPGASPVAVTLSTPTLLAATSIAGGRLTIARMKGDRIDLGVTGAGAITVAAAEATQLNATVIGSGALTIAGRATTARLQTNGPGTIDADALQANDVVVRLDGVGETRARARYTAQVVNVGLGSVTIAGTPKCTIKATATGPITCNPRPQ